MSEETKKYITVTYSLHSGRYQKNRAVTEGVRLIDWIRMNLPLETEEAASVIGQAADLIAAREQAFDEVMRGYVNPYIFIVDSRGSLSLLDFSDESNLAAARKAASGSVAAFFSPADTAPGMEEQAELFGLGRICQYILASNEEAGRRLKGTEKRRWHRFISSCMGEGMRPFTRTERAAAAFASVIRGRRKSRKRAERSLSWRAFMAAAICLAMLLGAKKAFYDTIPKWREMKAERVRIARQIRELSEEVEELKRDRDQWRHMDES